MAEQGKSSWMQRVVLMEAACVWSSAVGAPPGSAENAGGPRFLMNVSC